MSKSDLKKLGFKTGIKEDIKYFVWQIFHDNNFIEEIPQSSIIAGVFILFLACCAIGQYLT